MENNTVKAQGKYIRQSPYKMRLVLNLIRGLKVQDALNVLTFTKRKAAIEIKQVLESALANAEANYNLNVSDLYISKAIANEGPTLKRFRPRARGRAGKINKRTSHLLIELESVVE
ncbi:50S ribosomal protein L22 [Acidimicrobiaceae bacterium]|jgi:large subunit ribosomal protein L22|nr:50S ribosomal protein L22 [Acidimicrobiaceae bacterium]|tara:strand:- start:41 stop:388 length:348 start_codon:yes stop_codon:yes gene_type:complete